MPAAEPPDDGDPEEAVVSLKEGINSIPWHPSSFGPPYVYKVCFLGAREAGKSSIARRMVAHTFQSDPYRPTMQPQQLFWRYNVDGKDVLVPLLYLPTLGMTFEYHRRRYAYDADARVWVKIRCRTTMPTTFFTDWAGFTSDDQVTASHIRYGRNVFDVKQPTFKEMYKAQLLSTRKQEACSPNLGY